MNNLGITEAPYWITIAHLPRWKNERKNRLIVNIFHNKKMNLETFFSLTELEWKNDFELSENEILSLKNAKKDIPNNAFLAEDLFSQGFEMIPINAAEFSDTLKKNLKVTYTPTLLYTKGNKQLLKENSVAIVGSRKASKISLNFTDNIAKKASSEYKVVVSGFAKGVDKQALDSALQYNGQSIIVLPQGITTFKSGFKQYYKEIVEGNVLVTSTFHPKAKWNVGLAMARNTIIYGLANEIYVAESSNKGGTWTGVQDGLRKGRTIYVRHSNTQEKNANQLLIQQGAIGVDIYGNKVDTENNVTPTTETETIQESSPTKVVQELDIDKLFKVLHNTSLSSKEIVNKLQLNWNSGKMTSYLKKIDKIELIKGKPHKFKLKDSPQNTLF